MITLLLALATYAPATTLVEVCEINTTPNFTQVILRRWHRLGEVNGHRVTEWWIAKEPPTIERIGGKWLVKSDGREFIARSVRWTTTQHDPEMAERKILCPSDRVPYLEGGK